MQTPRRARRRATLAAAAVAAMGPVLLPAPAGAAGGVDVRDLSGSLTAADLAQRLAGSGVSIGAVSYTGAPTSAGAFTGGGTVVGFDSGVVLSTGSAQVGEGNGHDDATGYSSRTGDADLDRLGAGTTTDATVLAFDVTPDQDTLFFNYVFASEEYNEYVYQDVSDVFGFFVTRHGADSPQNCAVVADGRDKGSEPDPVSIDTVNGGNPYGSANASNPSLFRNNDPGDGGGLPAEPDGFTTVLRCVASVTPHEVNRLKLAISDVGDGLLDSWVFIQAGSITTSPDLCGDAGSDCGPGQSAAGSEGGQDAAPRPASDSSAASGEQEVDGEISEGTPIAIGGTATGPDDRPLATTWSYTPGPNVDPGATCSFADPHAIATTVTCTDDGVFTLTLTASAGRDATGSASTNLKVDNAPPQVSITQPTDTGRVVGGPVEVAAAVSDPGANDTRTCTIVWGDRSSSTGVLADGVCSGQHTYDAIGSYSVKVTVTDDEGASGSDRTSVVVAKADGNGNGGGFVYEGAG